MREKLKYMIRLRGYSQKQFAQILDITPNYMSHIIRCKRTPSRYIVLRIAEELGMTPEDVLSVEEIA